MSKSYSVYIVFLNSDQWGDAITCFKVSSLLMSALSASAVSIVRTVTMWMCNLSVFLTDVIILTVNSEATDTDLLAVT